MTCVGSFVAAIVSLGYASLAAQALPDAFTCQDFSFRDYKQRIIFSPMGFALTARTTIHISYITSAVTPCNASSGGTCVG